MKISLPDDDLQNHSLKSYLLNFYIGSLNKLMFSIQLYLF